MITIRLLLKVLPEADTLPGWPHHATHVTLDNLADMGINVYELEHLCKVWCYEQRYTIIDLGKWKDSEQASGFSYSTIAKSFDVSLSKAVTYSYSDRFHAATEYEAVIKPAEWVLEHAS
jgi:hypothetical protein